MDKFNEYLAQATNVLTCNSECQKENKTKSLEQTYLSSKQNLYTAPSEYTVAQKNYLSYSKSPSYYNEYIENELNAQAKINVQEFIENASVYIEEIKNSIETNDSLGLNLKNALDLLLTYSRENIFLYNNLQNKESDILINNRKSYYENQKVDRLKFFYYYIFLSIYFIFLLRFIILSFTGNSNVYWLYRIIIFICLVLLPIVSPFILGFVIFIAYKIYSFLPKNIYFEQTSNPPETPESPTSSSYTPQIIYVPVPELSYNFMDGSYNFMDGSYNFMDGNFNINDLYTI